MKCAICNKKLHFGLNKIVTLKDGNLCIKCARQIGLSSEGLFHGVAEVKSAETITVTEATEHFNDHKIFTFEQERKQAKLEKKQARAEETQQREKDAAKYDQLMSKFKEDKAWHVGKVYFDEKSQQILIKKTIMENLADEPFQLYDYSDLEGYDPIENGTTIEDKHGLSRTIAGGLIAGPTGAALGAFSGNKSYAAVSKVSVLLYFKGDHRVEAALLNETTKTDSSAYHITQQELLRFCHDLDTIIANNNSNVNEPATPDSATDSADQLRKLKGLLDDGILTEEEFAAKKKQILGI